MLLTYVDESYSRDRYFLAGIGIHHTEIRSLERSLHEVVERASRVFGVGGRRSELHGHPLFHGAGDWEGAAPRQRIAIYGWAFDALARHRVRVFLRGVNSRALRDRYSHPKDPHDVVLQHLLERVDAYAAGTGQAALVIADELHEHDRRRTELRDFRDHGTPGYLSSRLPRIVDTIHFAPSHHSRLIQSADLVAFLHHRRKAQVERSTRASRANEQLWARLAPCVEHDWVWHP